MLTLVFHSASVSRVAVWINGENAGVVSTDDIRPYAAIMDTYRVQLTTEVRALSGRVAAMMADIDSTEVAASESRR